MEGGCTRLLHLLSLKDPMQFANDLLRTMIANFSTAGFHKCICHSATNNNISSTFQQIFYNKNFIRHFCATNNGNKRFLCIVHYFFSAGYFCFHQQAKHSFFCRKKFGDYCSRGVCAVCCTKRIVYIYIAQLA